MSLATKIIVPTGLLLAALFAGSAAGDALPYHARAMATMGMELPIADRVLVRKSERGCISCAAMTCCAPIVCRSV